MDGYGCLYCGYVYRPEKRTRQKDQPGKTPLDELPKEWHCPVCGAQKCKFRKIEF